MPTFPAFIYQLVFRQHQAPSTPPHELPRPHRSEYRTLCLTPHPPNEPPPKLYGPNIRDKKRPALKNPNAGRPATLNRSRPTARKNTDGKFHHKDTKDTKAESKITVGMECGSCFWFLGFSVRLGGLCVFVVKFMSGRPRKQKRRPTL